LKKVIGDFIQSPQIALAGVSRNRKKWGSVLMKALLKKGYTVYPINPNADIIGGIACRKSVRDLPAGVENLIIAVKPESAVDIVRECSRSGIKRIWFHAGSGQGSYSREAAYICRLNGIEVVHGLCPLMFFPSSGYHRLHLALKATLGLMPKDYPDSGRRSPEEGQRKTSQA
jgi:uncharacterized protein